MIPVFPPGRVEVDSTRRYISVNDSACELLGYSPAELLALRIDDVSFPSGAHASPMFTQFLKDGSMAGIYVLRRKSGEIIRIRFESEQKEGRSLATWTHYEVLDNPERSPLQEQ